MWKPLLKAKLGEAYRETSAAFIWATIQRMYAARNSGLKKEMFGYVRGGYARVLGRFAEVLQEKGVEIQLNSNVTEVTTHSGKLELRHESKTNEQSVKTSFDQVIITASSRVAARICPQLSTAEKAKLNGVRYQGIVCASALLKQSLSEFYVTNITDETPFTGIIEMSALVDKREFGGNALVYLPKYVAPDDELFSKTDDEIESIFLDALARMYPHFRREDVVEFKVSRVREVFPIPTLNYSANLPPVKTSVGNLFVINSSQITNGTLNVNETVQLAEKFSAQLT
jgi:protoporphyrinogen oxidase